MNNTMNNILFLMGAASLPLSAAAQALQEPATEPPTLVERISGKETSPLSSHLKLQLNSMGSALFTDGELERGGCSISGWGMVFQGLFHENFSYYFRQSYTRNFSPTETDDVSMALEQMILTWKPSRRLTLDIGKQCMQLGGYEFWVAANRVRFYSDFNSTMSSYQTGVNFGVHLSPDHTLNLQALNYRPATEAADEGSLHRHPELRRLLRRPGPEPALRRGGSAAGQRTAPILRHGRQHVGEGTGTGLLGRDVRLRRD